MPLPSLSVQLITISIITLQRQLNHNNLVSRQTWDSNYDFIVIGAGTAGSVVAARLSENPNINVLLLEAGGPENAFTDMPGNYFSVSGNREYDWWYNITDGQNIGRAYTQPIHMSVGKILGGSSTLSGMVYNRGNRRHFDEWDHHYGCRGWNYSNILQYFLRSENNTDRAYTDIVHGYHNDSGPITVSSDWRQQNAIPIFKQFLESAVIAGYPLIDVNGPSQLGSTLFQHVIKEGTRVTTSSAYLSPNRNRTNLHILSKAMATRISFVGTTARSVTFVRHGIESTVNVNREVILSAGAIGSAQLLMLSGVGPRDHLNSFNIPLVADSPVGNNFHDHTNLILHYDIVDQSQSYDPVVLDVQNMYNYYHNQKGPLTMFPNAASYYVSPFNNQPDWPDIMTEMTRSDNNWHNLSDIVRQYGSNIEEWEEHWRPYVGRQLTFFDIQLVRPRARGTVRLASTDPNVQPLIDPNFLGDPIDMDRMVAGVKHVITRLTRVGPFATTARLIGGQLPGCTRCVNDPICDQFIRCLIRQLSVATYRQVGSCRCGSSNDINAVVDERLRVINVNNLRVIDSGIMPQVVNSNHFASTVMIAEYGSQMIKDDYNI